MPRRLTVLVAVLGLALVAGCGGSDQKKSNSTSNSGAPVSKAEYETRLVAGLRPAQAAGSVAKGITRRSSSESAAKIFDRVGGIYDKAYNDIKPIVPPKAVADVHRQVVAALQSLAQDSNRARDSLRQKDQAGYRSALNDFQAQGVKLQSLGKQLTARGY
jgi:hypothetical protein